MVFSSITFLFFFLPLVLLIYHLVPTIKWKNAFLLLASLVFYAWGEPVFVVVILFSSLLNYCMGLLIDRYKGANWPLYIGVTVNLAILIVAKYANFAVENLNQIVPEDWAVGHLNIPLPIGVSFFTFQAISYLVDVKRGDGSVQKNPLNIFLYITLFPQLIAGPIVRYHHVATELKRRVSHLRLFQSGIDRFVVGLGKKVLIANNAGFVADAIMNQPDAWNTGAAWLGMVAYTLQIYFDFSGYSDMAIGLGRMFGFHFHENFNFPYQAKSIQEFWRRWHISLSTWFRDYLYIPLGGNRKGQQRTYVNLLIVFFLTGLWHGASWNFVFWGLFHGAFLLVERAGWLSWVTKNKVFSHVYTLLVVMVGWVFFRIIDFSEAVNFCSHLLAFNGSSVPAEIGSKHIFFMVLGVLFSVNWKMSVFTAHKFEPLIPVFRGIRQFSLLLLLVICCLSIASTTYNPFIYFRF